MAPACHTRRQSVRKPRKLMTAPQISSPSLPGQVRCPLRTEDYIPLRCVRKLELETCATSSISSDTTCLGRDDPVTGTFALTRDYASPVSLVDTVTLLPNGVILAVAACCYAFGPAELFDPKTGSFSHTGARHPSAWGGPSTATWLTNGTVLFVLSNDGGL